MPVIALVVAAVILVSIVILLVVLVLFELRRKGQRRQPAAPAPLQSAPSAAAIASEPALPIAPLPVSSPPDDALPTTAYLQMNAAGAAPQRYPLAAAVVTIGRYPACTIPVAESLTPVSRRHAQIERDGDDYILTDLGSENGLFVDGVRAGRNLLRDGAVITLAQAISFTFHANHRNQP